MNNKNIIIIGGGHGGLMMMNNIQKNIIKTTKDNYSLILIDQNPYHTRKTILFKGITNSNKVNIPFDAYNMKNTTFIQGKLISIDEKNNTIVILKPDNNQAILKYEALILALGNVIRDITPEKGGFTLKNLNDAEEIRNHILNNIEKSKKETDSAKIKNLLTISIVGSGISGIETASEISQWIKKLAKENSLDNSLFQVKLFNSGERLLPSAPVKIGDKLEKELNYMKINVYHKTKVTKYNNNSLEFENAPPVQCGTCIWTIGTMVNPDVKNFGFPLKSNGKFAVDSSYHIDGRKNIYSIGDCAHIVDIKTGRVDEMTCKEASFQANKLCSVLKSELNGKKATQHKEPPFTLFCICLGSDKAFIWIEKFGINIILKGKLGKKIRTWTWDSASIMSQLR